MSEFPASLPTLLKAKRFRPRATRSLFAPTLLFPLPQRLPFSRSSRCRSSLIEIHDQLDPASRQLFARDGRAVCAQALPIKLIQLVSIAGIAPTLGTAGARSTSVSIVCRKSRRPGDSRGVLRDAAYKPNERFRTLFRNGRIKLSRAAVAGEELPRHLHRAR